ncbi:MAG: 1-acyl-sn-glycerol-3-phosphate acyltransferase [Burkholderiales bacterium]|nr:1-acyl-sn-glycerol-3-phosphate acyltransferase [Burkholderiales bacterium]
MPLRLRALRFGMGARLARAVLRVAGWRTVFEPPPAAKTVIVVYPHTSNWDFVFGFLARAALGLRCHFVAKASLFRGPLGAWLRRVGGIPVDRSAPTGFVEQVAMHFERADEFHLVFTPEGTRARTAHWKTGFYRVARAVKAPVGLAFIDYGRREVGVAEWIGLSGDSQRDLERMRRVYAGKVGRHPALQSPIRFAPPSEEA